MLCKSAVALRNRIKGKQDGKVIHCSKYNKTPVTQTLKGNEKQSELSRVRARAIFFVRANGVDCKIQLICHIKS